MPGEGGRLSLAQQACLRPPGLWDIIGAPVARCMQEGGLGNGGLVCIVVMEQVVNQPIAHESRPPTNMTRSRPRQWVCCLAKPFAYNRAMFGWEGGGNGHPCTRYTPHVGMS